MKQIRPLRPSRYPNPVRAFEPPALAAVTRSQADTGMAKALRNTLLKREGNQTLRSRRINGR